MWRHFSRQNILSIFGWFYLYGLIINNVIHFVTYTSPQMLVNNILSLLEYYFAILNAHTYLLQLTL